MLADVCVYCMKHAPSGEQQESRNTHQIQGRRIYRRWAAVLHMPGTACNQALGLLSEDDDGTTHQPNDEGTW